MSLYRHVWVVVNGFTVPPSVGLRDEAANPTYILLTFRTRLYSEVCSVLAMISSCNSLDRSQK